MTGCFWSGASFGVRTRWVPLQRGRGDEHHIDFWKTTTSQCSFRIDLICFEWQLSNRKFALRFSSLRSYVLFEKSEAEPELSCPLSVSRPLSAAAVSYFHACPFSSRNRSFFIFFEILQIPPLSKIQVSGTGYFRCVLDLYFHLWFIHLHFLNKFTLKP